MYIGTYLVDVLALKLGDELVETLAVSVDTDGLKDSLAMALIHDISPDLEYPTLMSAADGEVFPPRPRRR